MDRILKAACLCIALSFCGMADAQVMDTLRASIARKAKFTFKFDTRNSFIANRRAEIFGAKLGVEFDKKLRIGGGVHWLTSPLYKRTYLTSSSGLADSVDAQLSFRYFAYYIEYVFYKTDRWELSIPFQLGAGDSRYRYDYEGNSHVAGKKMVVLYEPGISTQYKVFRWLGAGADVGLRVMVVNNKAIKENFNSPMYAFKVLIWYDELYKMAFPNSWLTKKLNSLQ
jgi:hypothetical protein